MKKNNPINDNQLDELLRDLYLDENSQVANESEASFVLEQEYPVTINIKKEQALLNKFQGKSGFKGFRFFIISLVIGFMACLVFYFISATSNKNTPISKLNSQTYHKQTQHNSINNQNDNSETTTHASEFTKSMDTFGRPKNLVAIVKLDSTIKTKKESAEQSIQPIQKKLPYIKEQDRLLYANIKNQLLHSLIKLDKGLYTHLPANKVVYANKDVIVNAFNLRNISVTNLEYKAFLADLIIQKRTDDYTIAQLLTDNWTKINCNTLANAYFQDEKYNDFPVVNMTMDGAKLFCKWLEEEVQLYTIQHHLKSIPLQIRLPYDDEWIYAAREGYAKIAFEKGYNTMYDETERLVNSSFTSRVALIKKRVKKVDSLYTQFTTNKYGWTEKDILSFFNIGLNYYHKTPGDTIYTDRMKVLNKFGRASEIVYQRNNSRIWLSGLSWKNKETYLKLENEFKANASSPFVSFRFVVVNPNDPEYKNPFW
jgi:hypothetical protein